MRVQIRTKARHLSCWAGLANPAVAMATYWLTARVPSDARCGGDASVEGGQCVAPIRPAAGVGSRRAHQHIGLRPESDVQASRQSDHPPSGLRSSTCRAPRRRTHGARSGCACLEPTPAAGRIGLSVWPPSTLASPPHLASGGTRAGGTRAASAATGLARPRQQERCRALVRIGTRKHQSARPRAFRPTNATPATGRAAKARVTGCEIKASLSSQ